MLCVIAPDIGWVESASSWSAPAESLGGAGPVVWLIGDGVPTAELDRIHRLFVTRRLSGGMLAMVCPGTITGAVLDKGVRGIVSVDSPIEELVTAVRAVAAGHPFVPPACVVPLAGELAQIFRQDRLPEPRSSLTPRELEVLVMLAHGYTNAAVAAELFIAESTARTHVLAILRKIGARNRTEAALLAGRYGLAPPRGPD
jgi:DNA-binding CsgD family transcriptional regulator